jgi:CubicO group peptidase (beta-lactamase class C family)
MLTGLILARGVHEGLYVLARPLKDTLPADLAAGVTTETLGMTVAHHASFRPMPTNLDYSNMDSPGAGYTRAQLTTCLKNRECSRTAAPIGSTYLYSNLGIGILGQALVNIHKKASFEELLRDRLTAELEMDDTSADLKHYKSGYTVVGGFRATGDGAVGPATMGALVAAGGVLSSGEDMMKLMSQVVHPSGRWTGIMETAATPIMPGHAFAIDIRTREGMELFSKGGEQAGYSSVIIWNKQTGSGVFALANRGMQSESLAKFLIKIHARIAQGL